MPSTKERYVKYKLVQRSLYQAAICKNALNGVVDCPNITNMGWQQRQCEHKLDGLASCTG